VSLRDVIRTGLLAVGLLAGACHPVHSHDDELTVDEVLYLEEDTLDLMTVVFQSAENAFVGDAPLPIDVIEDAAPSNGYTLVYELPAADRLNLGFGSGEVALQVTEDGARNTDPLFFSIDTTPALTVEISYHLLYDGVARYGRLTVVDLFVTVVATRPTTAAPFFVDYTVSGLCDLEDTYCDVDAVFSAYGRPYDGIVPNVGGATVRIDDPLVRDVWFPQVFFADGFFRIYGEIACCSFLSRDFAYLEVL